MYSCLYALVPLDEDIESGSKTLYGFNFDIRKKWGFHFIFQLP